MTNERQAELVSLLKEFVADVDAVGKLAVAKDWPDLIITYNKIERALHCQGCGFPDDAGDCGCSPEAL